MKYYSKLTINNLRIIIEAFAPCQIYINKVLVWDDDDEEINSKELFNHIISLDNIVYSIKVDIVHFHHSIIYLEIEDNE